MKFSSILAVLLSAAFGCLAADFPAPQEGTWVVHREIKRVRNGRALLIPASEKTIGHGTTSQARFWKNDLEELLKE